MILTVERGTGLLAMETGKSREAGDEGGIWRELCLAGTPPPLSGWGLASPTFPTLYEMSLGGQSLQPPGVPVSNEIICR